MKSIILKLITASFLLSLIACVETTAPVCNSGNAADIPGIKSDYQVSFLVQADMPIDNQKLMIVRQGLGKYQVQSASGGGEMTTCQVGRFLVAESLSEAGTYKQQILNVGQNQSLTISQWIFDVTELSRQGIKYSVVDRVIPPHVKAWNRFMGIQTDSTEKVLIIENDSEASNKTLGKLARPNAFSTLLN